MNSNFLLSALAIIAVLTSLTTEGIKKILEERKKSYNSDILAVIVAIVVTIIGSFMYIIYNSIPITPQVIITIIALAFLSFLTATVGYDKLMQAIKQIGGK